MIRRLLALIAMTLASLPPVSAASMDGDYLYLVATVRAAPGKLADLLGWLEALEKSGFYNDADAPPPLVMRHSQGDHWDLMFVTPMGSWTDFYAAAATARREKSGARHAALLGRGQHLIAFQEDHFAFGPPFDELAAAHAGSKLYHIEMFAALPGKTEALLEQRRMENAYLAATGQATNTIFRRAAGSDIDVFTIGFHKDLAAFAAPAPATDDEKEAAAKAAGFKNRADLSFYLRSLISTHHDTLAVPVE